MSEPKLPQGTEVALLLGCAGCYIGHGAFGLITKEAWLPFFALVGISPARAFELMPVIGAVDILAGVSVLVFPVRAVLLYMTIWALWTAALRPLTGLGGWEFLERAGNYGVPLALLVLAGSARGWRDWFARIPKGLPAERATIAAWVLRVSTAMLLIGHGGFGLVTRKPQLVEHFAAVGLPPEGADPSVFLAGIGAFEILLGVAILARPLPALLVLALAWKLATEALYPLSGDSPFEFIERAGSYAAPLALLLLQRLDRR